MRHPPPELLRRLAREASSTLTIPDLYFHPNPLIRGLFWSRLERILSYCEGEPSATVLDLGCGGGELLPALAERFRLVVGLDLRPGLARRLVAELGLANVRLVCADLIRPPLRPGRFEVIIAADVLEHLPELENALEVVRCLLLPCGALIVSAPTENLLYRLGRLCLGYRKPSDHYHTAREIEAACLGAGFHLARKSYLPGGGIEAMSAFLVLKLRKHCRQAQARRSRR